MARRSLFLPSSPARFLWCDSCQREWRERESSICIRLDTWQRTTLKFVGHRVQTKTFSNTYLRTDKLELFLKKLWAKHPQQKLSGLYINLSVPYNINDWPLPLKLLPCPYIANAACARHRHLSGHRVSVTAFDTAAFVAVISLLPWRTLSGRERLGRGLCS